MIAAIDLQVLISELVTQAPIVLLFAVFMWKLFSRLSAGTERREELVSKRSSEREEALRKTIQVISESADKREDALRETIEKIASGFADKAKECHDVQREAYESVRDSAQAVTRNTEAITALSRLIEVSLQAKVK